jgi:hypothetical protein
MGGRWLGGWDPPTGGGGTRVSWGRGAMRRLGFGGRSALRWVGRAREPAGGGRWAGARSGGECGLGLLGHGREQGAVGPAGKGRDGPFLVFLSYFFIFCSFLFSPRFQIEFLIKRMLHKITHQTK